MNILIIMNGWITKISGGDYHIFKVAQIWGKKGVGIYYLVPRHGYCYMRNYLNGKIFIVHTPFEAEKRHSNIMGVILLYLCRIIKTMFFKNNKKFDVIVASSHFLYDVIPAIILGMKYKAKVVVYIHHLVSGSRYKFTFRSLISLLNELICLWLVRRFADLVVVVNPNTKEKLIKKGIRPDKICISGNGVDTDLINAIKVNEVKYDGCFVGRIAIQKGVYDLLYIWRKVVEVFPEAKLAIVGDGPEYKALQAMVTKERLNRNIILFGYLEDNEKIKVLKSSKMFILPSYEEGWGIVIGEAMASGIPVVCYELSDIKSIWNDNVIWVTKGNKEEFARIIIKLLKDADFRGSLSKKGQEFVKKYSWKNVAMKEFKCIYEVLKHDK